MPELSFSSEKTKENVFQEVNSYLDDLGLHIADKDDQRPWGGFFVIDQSSIKNFITKYFSEIPVEEIFKYGENISPKILLVAPNQKLSWQYHHRRAELWQVVSGPIGVIRSNDDNQGELETFSDGSLITHGPEVRHRLVGLDNWGVVAEIWQHTNPSQLSDENDIVRLEDSYGRN